MLGLEVRVRVRVGVRVVGEGRDIRRGSVMMIVLVLLCKVSNLSA